MDQELVIRRIYPADVPILQEYYAAFSEEDQRRFNPHSFDPVALEELLNRKTLILVGAFAGRAALAGYFVAEKGITENDKNRISTELEQSSSHIFSFAPSIASRYRGSGIADQMLSFLINELEIQNTAYLVLKGGVIADNERALRWYRKRGFVQAGTFVRDGVLNYSMYRLLRPPGTASH
jgi:diamine N-acetyltransferase